MDLGGVDILMSSAEKGSGILEKYKTFNKWSMAGGLGAAAVGAAFAPALIAPGLLWAGADAVQIYGINKWQNRKKSSSYETRQNNSKIRLFPKMPHFLTPNRKAA